MQNLSLLRLTWKVCEYVFICISNAKILIICFYIPHYITWPTLTEYILFRREILVYIPAQGWDDIAWEPYQYYPTLQYIFCLLYQNCHLQPLYMKIKEEIKQNTQVSSLFTMPFLNEVLSSTFCAMDIPQYM